MNSLSILISGVQSCLSWKVPGENDEKNTKQHDFENKAVKMRSQHGNIL